VVGEHGVELGELCGHENGRRVRHSVELEFARGERVSVSPDAPTAPTDWLLLAPDLDALRRALSDRVADPRGGAYAPEAFAISIAPRLAAGAADDWWLDAPIVAEVRDEDGTAHRVDFTLRSGVPFVASLLDGCTAGR
jgi:hypothetical protein